jgi:CheY-like chemotaxis protein
VSLPVQAVYEDGSAASSHLTPVSEASRAPGRLDGVTILVVDDEADARDLVATVLRTRGAEVTTASSVEGGLALLARRSPMVLVSDIGMPGTDGYEFIRRVRASTSESTAQIPAIALTAYAREEDRRRALEAGFHAHVSKPVEPEDLVRAVSSLMNVLP